MGFYDGWLFPRVLDRVMQQKQMVPFRERIGKAAHGRVLDIGIGSGLNLPFYGQQAEHVCGVDPSAELLQFAEERARKAHVPVELLRGSGEALPLMLFGVRFDPRSAPKTDLGQHRPIP